MWEKQSLVRETRRTKDGGNERGIVGRPGFYGRTGELWEGQNNGR